MSQNYGLSSAAFLGSDREAKFLNVHSWVVDVVPYIEADQLD